MSRKSATIFGTGTIPEPSGSHIGKGVALVARTAAFVYIYARIPQIAEMTLSFHATQRIRCRVSELSMDKMISSTQPILRILEQHPYRQRLEISQIQSHQQYLP